MYKLLTLPSQDLTSNSPYCLAYNSYIVSLENLVLVQLKNPLTAVFFSFSSHNCLRLYWYCEEKFCLSHSWESNGLLSVSSKKYVATKLLLHLASAFLAYQITVKKNLSKITTKLIFKILSVPFVFSACFVCLWKSARVKKGWQLTGKEELLWVLYKAPFHCDTTYVGTSWKACKYNC